MDSHSYWMHEALIEAYKAQTLNEVPVGAVVILNNEIIARAYNQPITACNPVAHAEILALQAAAEIIGNYRLIDCELYVTLEPCTMCAGALIHSRVKRLIFGAYEPKAGAVVSTSQVLNQPHINHRIEVIEGVLQEECSTLLSSFFRMRRDQIKQSKKQSQQNIGKPKKK